MADNQQDASQHEHRSSLTFVVDVTSEDRCDGNSQQGEYGEDGLGGTSHVTHIAVNYQGDGGDGHQTVLEVLLLGEVAGKSTDGNHQHNNVLNQGYRAISPEGTFLGGIKGEVALQHINSILLEGEDGAIVEYAQQGHEPEAKAGEYLAQVGNLEGVVLLFGLACLSIQLLIHKEVNDGHDEGDTQKYDAKGNGTTYTNLATQLGKIGRENHAGGNT